MAFLINDGYTLDGTLPARGRLPAVAFKYRPALPEATFEYLSAPANTGKQRLAAVVKLLADHLVSWDVVDQKENPVPLTAENIRKIPHRELLLLTEYVNGYLEDEQAADAKN